MNTLIGDVPDEWSVRALRELTEIRTGPSSATSRIETSNLSGVPVLMGRNLRRGRIDEDDVLRIEPDRAAALDRYALRDGDVVCIRTGVIGRHALVRERHAGWILSAGLLGIRPGGGINSGYLAGYFGLTEVQDWIKKNGTGSAVPTISGPALGALPVILPPLATQLAIGAALATFDEQVELHERVARTARRLRGALAPLLLTGAIQPPGYDEEVLR